MVKKSVALTEFGQLKSDLIASVAAKITAKEVSPVNFKLQNKLAVDIDVITDLLDTIEKRIRAAEIIYATWLEDANHDLLTGKVGEDSLPVEAEITFSFATNIFKQMVSINDKDLYRETIDQQFRQFVLLMATLYENIVRLLEILIRKIYLHLSTKAPLSTPFHDYLVFLKMLISLGYRSSDAVYVCVIKWDDFFRDYLPLINSMRNSFLHGINRNAKSDGTIYKVTREAGGSKLSMASPYREIDAFSLKVLDETRLFFTEIIDIIKQSVVSSAKIPC